MNKQTRPQHRADWNPTVEQAQDEYDSQNWRRMNGTMLAGWGRYRAPSIMAAPETEAEVAA